MKKKTDESPLIGAHMSISGGVSKAIERGERINCRTIQIFTKNNTRWMAPPLKKDEIERFHNLYERSRIKSIFAHDIYLINLASPDKTIYEKSKKAFLDEIERAEALNLDFLVFHPGAHRGSGKEEGLKKIAKTIRDILVKTKNYKVKLLFETTAGQGTSIGSTFEELGFLLKHSGNLERLGICLDTCHIFASGYDIRTEKGYQKVFDEFDYYVGIKNIKAIHLNDSKGDCGSHLDRHEHIGKGKIGKKGFKLIMNDKNFKDIPKVLETPKGEDMKEDVENMKILKSLCN
ncbi:MAG: deoxyribonuclease IV [Candidatus Schekmanbacteria bacterium]|nr:MAG: deoxyribonuclease IV [Candidatus Schekmanbacteria bacterium]